MALNSSTHFNAIFYFILRIAEKSGALVLSNDSFQEFHAERPWLFEPGRLIGGKPVPGVG